MNAASASRSETGSLAPRDLTQHDPCARQRGRPRRRAMRSRTAVMRGRAHRTIHRRARTQRGLLGPPADRRYPRPGERQTRRHRVLPGLRASVRRRRRSAAAADWIVLLGMLAATLPIAALNDGASGRRRIRRAGAGPPPPRRRSLPRRAARRRSRRASSGARASRTAPRTSGGSSAASSFPRRGPASTPTTRAARPARTPPCGATARPCSCVS